MARITAVGVIIEEWIMAGGALVFVLLRLWVRGWLQSRLALSDLFVVLAWLCFVASNINDYLAWKFGLWNENLKFGGSAPPLDLDDYIPEGPIAVEALKNLYTSSLPYYLLMYFVKGSFLLFYMKLFPMSFRKLRIALWVAVVFTLIGLVASMVSNIFWCWPIDRNWALDRSRQCLAATSDGPYFIAVGFHLISDLMIYALPFFLLRHLALSRRKIVGLALVFSLGGVCIGFTIARVVVVGDSVPLATLGALGSAEIATAIIVSCCPPLKWLYHCLQYTETGRLWRWRREETEKSTTRSRKGSRTSRTRTDLEKERERRGWTFLTMTAMDPDDGYDIITTGRSGRSERDDFFELERAGHDRDFVDDEELDGVTHDTVRRDSDTLMPGLVRKDSDTLMPNAMIRDENGLVMVGQRIMSPQQLDDLEAAHREARSNNRGSRGEGLEGPDEIRLWDGSQGSTAIGFHDDLRNSIRPER